MKNGHRIHKTKLPQAIAKQEDATARMKAETAVAKPSTPANHITYKEALLQQAV